MDFLHRCVTFCVVAALLWCTAVLADANPGRSTSPVDPQLRRLMQPSPAELASERRGRVYIYDSLEINQIDAALDQNFERMQHMMFIRVHHPPAAGTEPALVEDDGCD